MSRLPPVSPAWGQTFVSCNLAHPQVHICRNRKKTSPVMAPPLLDCAHTQNRKEMDRHTNQHVASLANPCASFVAGSTSARAHR